MNTIDIKAPAAMVRNFLLDPEIVLRLNPSWYVKDIQAADKNSYAVTLYDDRTDDSSRINLVVEVLEKSVTYTMNSATLEFILDELEPSTTRVSIRGDFFREEDLPYWLKGLKHYIRLAENHNSLSKWLLDRFWLRMKPSQRRITIIILLAEGIGLAALIVVAIGMKFMK